MTNAIPFNLAKSRLEINKYILLADKITSQLPVSYKLFVKGVNDNNVQITGDVEYVVLKDEFD